MSRGGDSARLMDGRYFCSCFETNWGGVRRKSEVCTHIAAVILHREYSRLLQPIYAAVIIMYCEGDYRLEIMDKEIKVIKQVKLMINDVLKLRYKVTYIITSNKPKTVLYKSIYILDIYNNLNANYI